MTYILEGIWLGDDRDAHDVSFLKSNEITVLCNLSNSPLDAQPYIEDILNISVRDHPRDNISDHFDRCIDFISKNREENRIYCGGIELNISLSRRSQ